MSAAPADITVLQRLAGNTAVSRMLAGHDETEDDATPHDGAPPSVQRSAVDRVLASPGRPLDITTRRRMETGLGEDLSRVRLHTDADSSRQLSAKAWTSGNHVVFDGPVDQHTLAHELTHVVQQRRGPVAGTDNGSGLRVSDPGDKFEREAEATARAITSGAALPRTGSAVGGPVQEVVQRAPGASAAGPSTAGPSNAGPSTAGPSNAALPAPPERLSATETDGEVDRPAGQIGGSDRILSIAGDDDVVIDALVQRLAHVLSTDEQAEVRRQVASRLRLQALQPQLSRLTRGDVLSVPLEVGAVADEVTGVTADITGDVKVSARVTAAATAETFGGMEFEDGTESFTAVTEIAEKRKRRQGGFAMGGDPRENVSLAGQATVLRDNNTRELVTSAGRSFARHKTKQNALRIAATIQIDLDLSGLRGPRALGLGPRRGIGSPEDVERGAAAATALAADIASPADEAAGAAGPETHYEPPQRVQDTHALGGMDVVQDIYTIDADRRRTRAGVRGILGSADDPFSVEHHGRALFTTNWPAVRDDLLAHLTMSSLQTDLKAMMVGEGIEIPLSHDRGSIVVGAEITEMTHVRNTARTEFNIGSDTTRTALSSQGYDWRLEGQFGAGGPAGRATITGTGLGEYGFSDNRMDEQTSVRSGNAVKIKTAGAVFDGIARLTFSLHKGPAGAGWPQDPNPALGSVGFQVVIEANDAKGVTRPTPFVAKGRPKAMTAPTFRPGEEVRKPRDETWAGPRGRGGLPAGTVVLDVLAGTNTNREPAVHNPVAELAGALGHRYIDRWETMRPQVRAAFSRDRLAASLPAMTRGVPLKSGPLIRVGRVGGYTQKPWRMSATARLRQLDFVREIGDDIEVNVLNDVATRSTAQHTSYWGLGAQVEPSGGGTVAPNVAPTPISMTGAGAFGAIGRLRKGTRAAEGSGTIASGKFPRAMAVYIATAVVHMDMLEGGVANPRGSEDTRVQFLVAVPRSATTAHTVTADQPSSFSPHPVLPQHGAGAGNAGGGALGPERVRREGRIGPTDVVVELEDDMAVIDAVKEQIGAQFGGDWAEAEAQLLPLFDAAALRPLAPALTQGSHWGTSVQAGKHQADVTIVSARARMSRLTDQVNAFEFEIGTDSTSAAGSLTANRLRGTVRPEVSTTFPYVTVIGGVTGTGDRLREGIEDDSATAVSRGKPVEPATLYAGELTFGLQVALPGQQAEEVTATMRGEFAFPTRDVEPVPAPLRRPPSRITESHVLGESDIVGDLLPPRPEPPQGAAAAPVAAAPGGPARKLTPRDIVDQLNTAGERVYGAAWTAVSAALQEKLGVSKLRTKLRSMMAGQAWTLDLDGRGTVAVTASVATLVPTAPVPEAEFNSGASGGTVVAGTEAGPTDEQRFAFAPSLGFAFTTNPSALQNGAIIGGYTQFYERGYDRTTDHGGTTQAGTGTKTKAPGVVYAGDLVLHFDFRPPRDRSPDAPEVAAVTLDRMRRIDELRQEIADLDAGRRQPPRTYRQAGESARDTRERYIRSRQARLDALLQRQFADVQSTSRQQGNEPAHRAAEAKLRFTVLVEQPDTLEVTTAGDARFEAGTPVPDGVRQARVAARPPGFGRQLSRLPKVDVTTQGLKADWVIRDFSDVGSLHNLLDHQGRQSYGNTWNAEPASGERLSERVKAAFGREKFMTDLARLTQGKTLDSQKFSVLGTTGWVSATAKVITLAQGRDEKKAEVTIIGETSARYRDRERTSHLLGGTGRFGGAATGEPGGLSGEALGTLSGRDREGGEAQSGGRVFANAKVPKDDIHFDGFVQIAFTFHPGTGSAEPARVAGIVPIIVAIPEKDTVVFEEPRPRTAPHDADDVTGDAEEAARQTAARIRDIEQLLQAAGVGAAALVTAGGRRHVDDVDLYRVDAVARDPHDGNQRPRIEWRDARTRRLLHPPWDARSLDVPWLERPNAGPIARPIGPQRPAGGAGASRVRTSAYRPLVLRPPAGTGTPGAPDRRTSGLRPLSLRPPERTAPTAGTPGPSRQAEEAPVQRAASVAVQRAFFGSSDHQLTNEQLRRGYRERALRPLTGDPEELELRRLRRERLDRAYGAPLGPKLGRPKPPEIDDQGDLRLNPLRYRLDDFPPALLLERRGLTWQFSVAADGEILIGSENPFDALKDDERTVLQNGMQQANPEMTEEEFRRGLTDQGHPTITAGFDETGRTTLQPARVSGELQWNEAAERFEIIDKSGRYMHRTVRPDLTPAEATRWLGNVASRMARHFGVPIHPVLHTRR